MHGRFIDDEMETDRIGVVQYFLPLQAQSHQIIDCLCVSARDCCEDLSSVLLSL
jgi:hypothetical protein